mmetsp:Transcript_28860/g.39946  ORF Transcript_28860/g.39946 Transcript_28860/m.39946 type:complete len:193 (-) Transcript_28860:187-765(-)|eukprot:CAMPEP_0201492198 /NCGR_PEP_ID=MMETSP0151_2-20130828/32144_1 /ASSEMBLY_ACC=CAM_ASM_000257 /TAXON_ID=200890 /ORGANISM="Paramoeba atlantica, Strain 621/1 / CCAP 1560/9" /LENGTH=192 /DNA_ID=CAMNT_0047878877 /DNA_START=102 /DNA_END=680 /DNA_ORIENTATION=+
MAAQYSGLEAARSLIANLFPTSEPEPETESFKIILIGNVKLAEAFCQKAVQLSGDTKDNGFFGDVCIYRISVPLDSGKAFIDFHILPEQAPKLANSDYYLQAKLVLVVADMSIARSEEYVRAALSFPKHHSSPNCPMAVLAFGECHQTQVPLSFSSFQNSLAESDGVGWIDASVNELEETIRNIMLLLFDEC